MTCCLSTGLFGHEAGVAACCYAHDTPWFILRAEAEGSVDVSGLGPWPRQMPDILLCTCRSAFTPAQQQQMRMLSQRRRQMVMLQQQRMMQQIMWQMSRRGGGFMGPFGMQGPFMF